MTDLLSTINMILIIFAIALIIITLILCASTLSKVNSLKSGYKKRSPYAVPRPSQTFAAFNPQATDLILPGTKQTETPTVPPVVVTTTQPTVVVADQNIAPGEGQVVTIPEEVAPQTVDKIPDPEAKDLNKTQRSDVMTSTYATIGHRR